MCVCVWRARRSRASVLDPRALSASCRCQDNQSQPCALRQRDGHATVEVGRQLQRRQLSIRSATAQLREPRLARSVHVPPPVMSISRGGGDSSPQKGRRSSIRYKVAITQNPIVHYMTSEVEKVEYELTRLYRAPHTTWRVHQRFRSVISLSKSKFTYLLTYLLAFLTFIPALLPGGMS